jgi:hypothetical protein
MAYGATDVMHDRNYLLALMRRGPRDPLAQAAEKQWALMDQQETQQAQLGATRENLAEQIRSREGAQAENIAQREQRAKETGDYRSDLLAQRAEEAKDRESARMLAVLPELITTYGPVEGPKRAKAIMDQFMAQHGVAAPAAGAPDATTAAAQRFAGKPVTEGAPPTAGGPAVDQSTGRHLTPQERTAAPPITFAPSGTVAAPTAPAAIPPELEYVRPPGTVGMINGRPAGDVIAEGALRTGVLPESESGKTALTARLSKGGLPGWTKTTEPTGAVAAETPIKPPTPGLNARLGAAGEAMSKYTDPLGTAVKAVGGLFSGGGGGAEQIVKGGGGPTPEPTPSGPTPQGPFSGSIGNITQGPEPTPAGTPPAVPVPGGTPNIPAAMQRADVGLEVLRRRMAQSQTQ